MSETIRTVKSGRFSIIDNQMLENAALSLQAKGLQAYLLSRPDGWKISPVHLASTCKGGVSQIKATLKELEIARYIHREQLRNDKGRITGWINWIYESPALNPYPPRGLSRSGKSTCGKSTCGISTPINTESNKTEIKENSPDRTRNPKKSAHAEPESLISPDLETSEPPKPLERLSNIQEEGLHQLTREDGIQSILETNQTIINPSFAINPDPSEGKEGSAPRRTTSDNSKGIFGNERPIERQKAQAKESAHYHKGKQNPTQRWKDLEDYQRFEAYVVEAAQQRRESKEEGEFGAAWIRSILNFTATCTDENSPRLLLWKS